MNERKRLALNCQTKKIDEVPVSSEIIINHFAFILPPEMLFYLESTGYLRYKCFKFRPGSQFEQTLFYKRTK